ncbi:pyruvate formate lyase-activating protein [Neiella marina]|uniref:Pyruvate formate lyase-activating protein n=1 Tax=Neiella marina TaxID=508461 RepID=A0A8J2U5S2_9GAMM|nr:glycyl-radical enzyme activating protein [Neiella marina]GGA79596.1 pyruvate formate lyase-activating protein [Neiella marina]
MYFNIQRFSNHDGDGIRTILFLKGCSLSCAWCQNPESQSRKRSLLFDQRSCLADCQLCAEACSHIQRDVGRLRIERSLIDQQQLIALQQVCPTQALSVCGQPADADQLLAELLRDKPFYQQSGGGVTFSGGEPLMQPQLVADLAQRLQQQSVSTAVETCMHVPWKNIEMAAPYIDCWLTDLKHTDADKFNQWAHGSVDRIKQNFSRLAAIAKRLVVRVPVVPGFNDSMEELQAIIDFAASLAHCHELHLLPYHTLGINKYRLLDQPYECADKPLNKPELLQDAQAYAHSNTHLDVVIRG